MPSRTKGKLKTYGQLCDDNSTLERWERDVVLGRKVNIGKFRDGLQSFLEDCRRKLAKDKRLGRGKRGRLKSWILHWQLLDEELKKGKASTLRLVPRKIPALAQTPLPEPLASMMQTGYLSPIDTIRVKMGWPKLLKPSETRLFDVDTLPAFQPVPLGMEGDREGES